VTLKPQHTHNFKKIKPNQTNRNIGNECWKVPRSHERLYLKKKKNKTGVGLNKVSLVLPRNDL